MLRDNFGRTHRADAKNVGFDPLAHGVQKQASDDGLPCLGNPCPEGAESSLTENVTSLFQPEPAQDYNDFQCRQNAESFRMSNKNIASAESTNTKLKVGLIVDSEFASKYVYELAEWAQTQNDLLISHLLILKAEYTRLGRIENGMSSSKKKGFLNLIRLISFALITKVENFRMRGDKRYKNHLKRCNLKEIVAESITIPQITSKTESVYQYSGDDIQKIKDLDLDVLILCSSGILRGEL